MAKLEGFGITGARTGGLAWHNLRVRQCIDTGSHNVDKISAGNLSEKHATIVVYSDARLLFLDSRGVLAAVEHLSRSKCLATSWHSSSHLYLNFHIASSAIHDRVCANSRLPLPIIEMLEAETRSSGMKNSYA
jgi:hypothetical protein